MLTRGFVQRCVLQILRRKLGRGSARAKAGAKPGIREPKIGPVARAGMTVGDSITQQPVSA